jgi:hypothetical protein
MELWYNFFNIISTSGTTLLVLLAYQVQTAQEAVELL